MRRVLCALRGLPLRLHRHRASQSRSSSSCARSSSSSCPHSGGESQGKGARDMQSVTRNCPLRIDPVNSTPTRVPILKTWWPESHWRQFAIWRCLSAFLRRFVAETPSQGTVWQHTVYSVLSASFARSSPFSVAKAPTRFGVDAGVMFSCFRVVTCIFCQAEKHSWIRTTSAVTAPSTRQHKSFKIRFLVFSWDVLGVQKGGFPAKVGLRRPWRVLPGKSQDTFTSALALRLTCVLVSASWARSAQRHEEPLSTTVFGVGVLGRSEHVSRPSSLSVPSLPPKCLRVMPGISCFDTECAVYRGKAPRREHTTSRWFLLERSGVARTAPVETQSRPRATVKRTRDVFG